MAYFANIPEHDNQKCCCVCVCRFAEGEVVTVEIDQARRRLNARIHSAGHLLDSALIRLGMTDLVPSKVGPAKATINDHFICPVH